MSASPASRASPAMGEPVGRATARSADASSASETARAVDERRAAARHGAANLAEPLVCRVNPGHEVDLVNVSSVGACVEAAFALLPGRPLQLHAHAHGRGGRRAAIEARVMWCRVTAVMSGRGVRYTAGLSFMRWVDVTRELAALEGTESSRGS
jgi:hypothetical protein